MHTGSSLAAAVLSSPCYLASGWAAAQTLLCAGLAGAPGRGRGSGAGGGWQNAPATSGGLAGTPGRGGGPGAGGGLQNAPATSVDGTPSPPQTQLREAAAGTTLPAPRGQSLAQEGPSCAGVPSPHASPHTSLVTPQVWLICKFTELKEENPPPPALHQKSPFIW